VSSPEGVVSVDLTDDERSVLRQGLLQWGGPAQCSEEMAVAMGFRSCADLWSEGLRIRDELERGDALSRLDWTRALLATEIVFASYVMGAAWDWSIVTGMDDADTLQVLRGLQPKLGRAKATISIGTPGSI
jgi:hypothetical protein